MNYYTLLEATNALILQQQWRLRRCRRRCDAPNRYVVFDAHGAPVLDNMTYKGRRLGLTLQEILMLLGEQDETTLATAAQDLLQRLNRLAEEEERGQH